MRILHLGGSALGAGVLAVLRRGGDEVESVDDLEGFHAAFGGGDVDWIVSAGFRHLLRRPDLARAGDTCNVHPSLLPWGRGANPNVWVIARGEPAGVSIHRMVEAVDAGPVFAQRPVTTSFDDTAAALHARLEATAVALFEEAWPAIRDGRLEPVAQAAGGSEHRVADMRRLGQLDLAAATTWGEALAVLRALTFPPHRNVVVEVDGRRYGVELAVEDLGPA